MSNEPILNCATRRFVKHALESSIRASPMPGVRKARARSNSSYAAPGHGLRQSRNAPDPRITGFDVKLRASKWPKCAALLLVAPKEIDWGWAFDQCHAATVITGRSWIYSELLVRSIGMNKMVSE
jgi:hypothetical protein